MAERITDTVAWHPEPLNLPGSSPLAELTLATKQLTDDLAQIIQTPSRTQEHRAQQDELISKLVNSLDAIQSKLDILIAKKDTNSADNDGRDQRVIAGDLADIKAKVAQLQRVKVGDELSPSDTPLTNPPSTAVEPHTQA